MRYRAIRASIQELGIVEPLVVCAKKGAPGTYSLLDGHLRLIALQELGEMDAECIVSGDDERKAA